MNIPADLNAPVYAKAEIWIHADFETVWKSLTHITQWPQWQKDVTWVEEISTVKEGISFKWKAGGLQFRSKIHTCDKFKGYFGWTGKTFGASAIHNWFLVIENDGVKVMVEESLNGLFPKLLRKKIGRDLSVSMQKSLNEMKIYCEQEKL
ncbi:MAG: hypothetical protein Fur0041_20990 [Bacteroidia bacterium]